MLRDLVTFAAIARHASFSRASRELGVSRSALSHRMRALEERLDVRLLNRTTRSVSLTFAGEHLLARIEPALATVARSVRDILDAAEQPAGQLKLNISNLAARVVLAPRLRALRETYPRIDLEVSVNDALVDIVAAGFDAGIRFHDALQLDMISVPVGPRIEFAVVGSPEYVESHPTPHHPLDLLEHDCIGFRLIASRRLYAWEFARDGEEVEVAAPTCFTTDSPGLMVQAALEGVGLAYANLEEVRPYLQSGSLVRVLAPWCEPTDRLRLFYPQRERVPHTLRALLSVLRT
ncbi:MAG: LysR family transcriptional regulator [Myxococcota bacterium]